MKRYYILILALLLACQGIIAQSSLERGLVARYLFNGSADDASSNKNNGKKIGGVENAKDRFGNDCGAFAFNGIDGYIEVPHSRSLSAPQDEITVAVWMKLGKGTKWSELQWMTVVCKSENLPDMVSAKTISCPIYQ